MRESSVQSRRFSQFILRPFATNTDRRFYLFILAILSTSLYVFRSLLVSLPLSAQYTNCIQHVSSMTNVVTIEGLPVQCSGLLDLQLLLYLLLGEVVLFGTAFLIYWYLPS